MTSKASPSNSTRKLTHPQATSLKSQSRRSVSQIINCRQTLTRREPPSAGSVRMMKRGRLNFCLPRTKTPLRLPLLSHKELGLTKSSMLSSSLRPRRKPNLSPKRHQSKCQVKPRKLTRHQRLLQNLNLHPRTCQTR